MPPLDPHEPQNRVILLGTPISRLGMSGAIEATLIRAAQGLGGYICFANVHTVTEATQSPDLARALREAFLPVADGVPLVWLSRMRGKPIESRVCGPDFMAACIEQASQMRHAFLGGAQGQGQKLITQFNLKSAVAYSPPFRPFNPQNAEADWNQLLEVSGSLAPQIVWVGLGAPKQELWMNAVSRLPSARGTVFLGVGAAFDFLTGTKSRAPLWMQKIGCEWLYRLGSEPGRLWKRYLSTNPRFIWLALLESLK